MLSEHEGIEIKASYPPRLLLGAVSFKVCMPAENQKKQAREQAKYWLLNLKIKVFIISLKKNICASDR